MTSHELKNNRNMNEKSMKSTPTNRAGAITLENQSPLSLRSRLKNARSRFTGLALLPYDSMLKGFDNKLETSAKWVGPVNKAHIIRP